MRLAFLQTATPETMVQLHEHIANAAGSLAKAASVPGLNCASIDKLLALRLKCQEPLTSMERPFSQMVGRLCPFSQISEPTLWASWYAAVKVGAEQEWLELRNNGGAK